MNDYLIDYLIRYFLTIGGTYFLFLLIVRETALAVKTIFLFFAVNSKFYSFFDIFKNNAEKLLTIIENIDNNTTMKNLFASLFYFLTFSSPSLIFLLTTKNEFLKFHSIQSTFLRQYLFKPQSLNQPLSNPILFILRLIAIPSIVIYIITILCCCTYLPDVLSLPTNLSKIYLAYFIISASSILPLAIILYFYYSVFSLYRETQEGKCTESPLVKNYINEFLIKPIKISRTISFSEVLTSFLILLTDDVNISLKKLILTRISLWSIKDYQQTILTTILILWIIAFCSFLHFFIFSTKPVLPEEISYTLFPFCCCAFIFSPILTAIALPKILPAPKLITSFIDQLSKEDDL